ncbi:MAG: tetratricopeptide repeat protein [Rhodocyclaceae bacterium]|nr:tetratricopeptide repeat protein [Rhodocyclaceae bacterium]
MHAREPDSLLKTALQHHQAGRLAQAEALYRRILAAAPQHAGALHLLGVLALQAGRHEEAAQLIGRAIAVDNRQPAFHNNLGEALRAAGRIDAARASYEAALALQPNYADAHSNLGIALQQQGRAAEAEACFRRALALRPDHAMAAHNLGNALMALGRQEEAAASFRRALAQQPGLAEAHCGLGRALLSRQSLEAAASAFQRALALRPDLAEARLGLGGLLLQAGRADAAEVCFREALARPPDLAEAHCGLGIALLQQERFEQARAAFEQALALAPGLAEANFYLGNVWLERHRLAEAMAAWERALASRPDYAHALQALAMAPHYLPRAGHAGFLAAARRFAAAFSKDRQWRRNAAPPAEPERRLRIGYVSGDFFAHPVGFFLDNVLPQHDRSRFEVHCYSNYDAEDEVTARLRAAAQGWRSIAGLADGAAADLIAADGIDILIDLAGHTDRNRLALFALRPAPVQASWLGYFGTTGLEEMDYVIADRHVVPAGEEAHFVEKIWRLPHSYLCFAPPDCAASLTPPPLAAGQPPTFGCFNNPLKLSDGVLLLWARLLRSLPGARLLLKSRRLGDAEMARVVRGRLTDAGVEAGRILIEGVAPRQELLQTYNRVDIALDPFPFGGGTTSAEALWMGVPVVTLKGDRWAGRVSESILATIGLEELVARNEEEYLAIAAALAEDPRRLAALRATLRGRLERSPFCDGASFARDLEAAWRGMWREWCAQQARGTEMGR